ncbi:MAG: 50S ribosomal protein L10 [Actinobacteria bacterium]|nr:50S ribosomal protein L10 [Actinomycetota bacterium]
MTDVNEARAGKVAVVDEVRERLSSTEAVVLTEYRGLDVPALAELRRALRDAGGEYKIYKNTLVRFAVQELGLDLEDLLIGPTAMAFVGEREDGTAGDAVSVARALREFAKDHESLLIKGGLLDGKRLGAEEIDALAQIAPREVLLAQLAGAMAAPMQQFAGLLQALPQNMAYALKALIEERGGVVAPADADAADAAGGDDDAADADAADGAETEVADADAAADEVPAEVADADKTEEAADEAAAEETDAEADAEAEDTEEG